VPAGGDAIDARSERYLQGCVDKGTGYIWVMAAHHRGTSSWLDTPCNPIVGFIVFVAGVLAIWMLAVYAASLVMR
jgi:hypothetical protein